MWPDWLKVIQLKPRFLFAICVLGVVILWLPQSLADIFGVAEIRQVHRTWIGLVTLAGFIFWMVQLLPCLTEWNLQRKLPKLALEAIESLSEEEKLILAYCLVKNQRTILLPISNPAVAALCDKWLLEKAEEGNILRYPYTVPLQVWRRLAVYQDQLLPNGLTAEVRRTFDDFEHGNPWC